MRIAVPLALLTLSVPLAGCGVRAHSAPSPRSPVRGATTPGASTARSPESAAAGACGLDAARLAALGAPVRMASVATVYPHSPANRNQNLAAAARYLCGRVVASGATLSFNSAIGDTTPARGYTFGPTFVGNRVVPGLGGGVCQVASTLYGAWRKAGLRVLERYQHGMRVPYVPPGEDATVSSPYLDLVVRNSSPGPVVVAAVARANRVEISLFGTQPPPQTAFRHEILSTTPFPTLRIADPTRYQGEEITAQEGVDGVVAHTWYSVKRVGREEQVFDLGIDRYRPSPHIIRYGTRLRPAQGRTPHAAPGPDDSMP